jgi:hypothetical protein
MRGWIKQYGNKVRIVGPLGIDRMIFVEPEALRRLLVTGWADYPRVIL